LSEIRVGSYVKHPQRPQWGLGKVFCLNGPYLLVGFQKLHESERFKRLKWTPGLLEPAPVTADPVLDSWTVECDSTCREVVPVSKGKKKVPAGPIVAEWTQQQAYERFLEKYPGGFEDPAYGPAERGWKWSQHELWKSGLPAGGFRALATGSPADAADLIMKVVQTGKTPLLHPRGELFVFRDSLANPESLGPYLTALADLLEATAITSDVFNPYLHTLLELPVTGTSSLAKWTIVTAVPFLADPDRHMFLKPTPTRAAAKGLGIDLNYTPTPKWDTYERLLHFSHQLHAFLRPLGARDMIDVQAFMAIIAATPPAASLEG